LQKNGDLVTELQKKGILPHILKDAQDAIDFSNGVTESYTPAFPGAYAKTTGIGQPQQQLPSVTIPGAPTLDIPPDLRRLGVEQSPQDEGKTFVFSKPQATEAPPEIPFSDKYTSDVEAKRASAASSNANAGYLGAKTLTERLHQPNLVKLDEGLIHQREGAAAASRATAAATPQRVQNEQGKAAETVRHNQEQERLTGQANGIRSTMANIAQQNATNSGKDTASKIKLRTAQEAKLNKQVQDMGKGLSPEKKAALSKLHPYYVDPLQGLVPVEEQIAATEDLLGMERGSLPRNVTMPNRPTKSVKTSAPKPASHQDIPTADLEERQRILMKKAGRK
jgi:hypothetical protein